MSSKPATWATTNPQQAAGRNRIAAAIGWVERHPLWFLFGVAFTARLLPTAMRFVIGSDEALYLTLGQNLAQGLGFTANGETPHTEFAPGYPFFAAAVYLLGGGLELPAQLNLILFGSLLPLPVYWLTRQLSTGRYKQDSRPALLAGLFAALLPGLALGLPNFEAPTEQLYILFLYLGWGLLWWGVSQPRTLIFLLAGLAIGAAHITRWEGMFAGIFGLGVIMVLQRRAMIRAALPFVAGLAVFAIPYGTYLYNHTGSFLTPKGILHQFHGASFDARVEDPFAFEKAYLQYEENVADLAALPSVPAFLWTNREAFIRHYIGNVGSGYMVTDGDHAVL